MNKREVVEGSARSTSHSALQAWSDPFQGGGWYPSDGSLTVGVSPARKTLSKSLARVAATVAVVAIALVSVGVGALDSSGASGGERSDDIAYALAAGRGGTLVVAGVSGSSTTGSEGDWALARYTARGRLDPRFGTKGRVLTHFRKGGYAQAVAVQANGKPVLAGFVEVALDFPVFALARYTHRGKLDRGFGRNGLVLTHLGDSSAATALAIQPDGKLVAVGTGFGSIHYFTLARYTVKGQLDPSFGHGGKVVTSFGAHGDPNASPVDADASAVAIQTDGKVVVAGTVGFTFGLARYTADGTLDRSFGSGGRVVTKVGDVDSAYGVVVQPDGKVVIAGSDAAGTDPESGRGDLTLLRYTADGKLDPGFGTGGELRADAGVPGGIAIQPDRKLITAGVRAVSNHREDPREFALARCTENGSLDPSFGRGGKLLTDFHAGAKAVAVVVGANGKIVAAGTVRAEDFALARYTSGGRLDGSFGRGGKVVTDFELLRRTRLVGKGG